MRAWRGRGGAWGGRGGIASMCMPKRHAHVFLTSASSDAASVVVCSANDGPSGASGSGRPAPLPLAPVPTRCAATAGVSPCRSVPLGSEKRVLLFQPLPAVEPSALVRAGGACSAGTSPDMEGEPEKPSGRLPLVLGVRGPPYAAVAWL